MFRILVNGAMLLSWLGLSMHLFASSSQEISLEAAIDRALSQSEEIQMQKDQNAVAHARIQESYQGFLPTVQVGAQAASRHTGDVQGGNQDQQVWMARAQVIQNLFSSFSTHHEGKAWHAQLEGGKLELRWKAIELRQQIISSYFEIQKLKRELQAEKDMQAVREKQKKEVQVRIRQGRATQYEQTVLKVEDAVQQTRILDIEKEIQSQEFELKLRMGVATEDALVLTDPMESAFDILGEESLWTLEKALDTLLRSNPKLQALREKEKEAIFLERKELARYGPEVNLVWESKVQSLGYGGLNDDDNKDHELRLEVQIPIFSGLGSLAKRRQIRSLRASYQKEYEKHQKDFLLELKQAYLTMDHAKKKLAVEEEAWQQAKKATQEAQMLYRQGRLDLFRVLESFKAQLTHELGRYQAMYEQVLGMIEIKSLTGI